MDDFNNSKRIKYVNDCIIKNVKGTNIGIYN